MARPKGINQKLKWRAHSIRIARYADRVQSVYDTLSKEVAKMVLRTNYDGSKPFSFSDYPATQKKFEEVRTQFVSEMRSVIYSGTSEEWKQSNLVQDLLADKVLKFYGIRSKGKKYRRYYQSNSDVLKAFQQRKEDGLNLSQMLWNQSASYKEEMEYCLSSAIEKGTSAVKLSKKLSKYLVDFPSLKKDYKEKYGKAVTCKDCEYRSIRLARSEINMAYRMAEQERWKQFDFILGYEVKLTQNGRHVPDICDDLAGKYSKYIVFKGWHPNCMCYVIPILKSEEEFWHDYDENEKQGIADNLSLSKGKGDIEISDAIEDLCLPSGIRKNLSQYSSLRSYNDLVKWFKGKGIELTTDLESLTGPKADEYIKSVAELGQKIAVAVDSYQSVFGKECLRKLQRIKFYDTDLDNVASYHYNALGEHDPLAGTIRFRNWSAGCREVFHEIAHAFQDSMAMKGEDAVLYSSRILSKLNLSDAIKAYSGAAKDVIDAERFADAFAFGFTTGRQECISFIKKVYEYESQHKYTVARYIEEIPEGMRKWIFKNERRIYKSSKSGTLPYWIKDNTEILDDVLKEAHLSSINEARQIQYNALVNNESYYRVAYNSETGGLMATHIEHNFDKVGGEYEKQAQRIAFKEGHSVILGKETGGGLGVRYTEGLWDGLEFELSGRETATENNIFRGLKHCAQKRSTEVAVLYFPNGGFENTVLDKAIRRYKGLKSLQDGQYKKFDRIVCIEKGKIVYDRKFD